MVVEIVESTRAVERIIADDIDAEPLVEVLRRCRGVALVARGSSGRVAAYARCLLEQALGVPVWSVTQSQFTRYGISVDVKGLALTAVSESGRTPEIVSVAETWMSRGAVVAGITNDASSDFAALVEHVLMLDFGDEVAGPATRSPALRRRHSRRRSQCSLALARCSNRRAYREIRSA